MGDDLRHIVTPKGWHRPMVSRAAQAALLFGLWVALSGKLDALFLTAGAISVIVVVVITELVFRRSEVAGFGLAPSNVAWLLRMLVKFVAGVPLMAFEIAVANVAVTRMVLAPRLSIDPSLIEFSSPLTTEAANALLAQSITLTPGSITVDMSLHRFLVHCVSSESRRGIEEAVLMRRVARVFGEPEPALPVCREIETPDEVSW